MRTFLVITTSLLSFSATGLHHSHYGNTNRHVVYCVTDHNNVCSQVEDNYESCVLGYVNDIHDNVSLSDARTLCNSVAVSDGDITNSVHFRIA